VPSPPPPRPDGSDPRRPAPPARRPARRVPRRPRVDRAHGDRRRHGHVAGAAPTSCVRRDPRTDVSAWGACERERSPHPAGRGRAGPAAGQHDDPGPRRPRGAPATEAETLRRRLDRPVGRAGAGRRAGRRRQHARKGDPARLGLARDHSRRRRSADRPDRGAGAGGGAPAEQGGFHPYRPPRRHVPRLSEGRPGGRSSASRRVGRGGTAPGEDPAPHRPIERDLENVLVDLAADFPLLGALVERRAGGQRRIPIGRPETGRADGEWARHPSPTPPHQPRPRARPSPFFPPARRRVERAATFWRFASSPGRRSRSSRDSSSPPSGSTTPTPHGSAPRPDGPTATTSRSPSQWRSPSSPSSRMAPTRSSARFSPAGVSPGTARARAGRAGRAGPAPAAHAGHAEAAARGAASGEPEPDDLARARDSLSRPVRSEIRPDRRGPGPVAPSRNPTARRRSRAPPRRSAARPGRTRSAGPPA